MSMNQRTQPNKTSNRTSAALVSPVDVAELADYLGISTDDTSQNGLLERLLLSATQACIDYTNIELLQREWVFRADRYPERQKSYTGIGVINAYRSWWVNLPLYPVISIDSVVIDGDTVDAADRTDDLFSKPCRLEFDGFENMVVTYQAGHTDKCDIAPDLISGILAYAAYQYEKRGACDPGNVLKDSGAINYWRNSRMIIGGL